MAAAAGSSLALALAGVFFFSLVAPGVANTSYGVGGPRGWRVPDANTSYGWWAMNNRFHVGDHLCEYPKCSYPDGNQCNLFNSNLRLSTAVVDGVCLSVGVMI